MDKSKEISLYTITLDDDPLVHKLVAKHTGLNSLPFNDSSKLLKRAKEYSPVAAFIDIHLANEGSGLDIIHQLKTAWPLSPVIVITSDKSDEIIREALATGADDFVRKPFNPHELQARLSLRISNLQSRFKSRVISFGDLTLDTITRDLKTEKGECHLQYKEAQILSLLMNASGQKVSRIEIMRYAWGDTSISKNAVDRRIHEIRTALKVTRSKVQLKTIYGKGLKLESEHKVVKKISNTKGKPMGSALPRILIVDDNTLNLEVISAICDSFGVEYDTAENGQIACVKSDAKSYDIVLMDCQMPVLDGYDATHYIKGESMRSKDASIYALVGKADSAIRERCHQAGMIGIVLKPLKKDDLQLLLNNWSQGLSGAFEVSGQEFTFKLERGSQLDAEVLKELYEIEPAHGKEFIEELLQTFLDTAVPHFEDLLVSKDNEEIIRLAHKLRGMCSNIGARELANICDQIEFATKNGDRDPRSTFVKVFKSKYMSLVAEIGGLLS